MSDTPDHTPNHVPNHVQAIQADHEHGDHEQTQELRRSYNWGAQSAFWVLGVCLVFPKWAHWGVWFLMAVPVWVALRVAWSSRTRDPSLCYTIVITLVGVLGLVLLRLWIR